MQGITVGHSMCASATDDLFSPNDTCSEIVQQSNNDFNNFIDEDNAALFMGDCPARFRAYVTACLPNDVKVRIIIMYIVKCVNFSLLAKHYNDCNT